MVDCCMVSPPLIVLLHVLVFFAPGADVCSDTTSLPRDGRWVRRRDTECDFTTEMMDSTWWPIYNKDVFGAAMVRAPLALLQGILLLSFRGCAAMGVCPSFHPFHQRGCRH